jgi:hypothetical protein
VVKQAMVSSIKSTMDLSNFKYSEMQELAVTAIINSEILKQTLLGLHSILSLESRTRLAASHTSKIKTKWKQLWLKHHNKESCLVLTFAENVKR